MASSSADRDSISKIHGMSTTAREPNPWKKPATVIRPSNSPFQDRLIRSTPKQRDGQNPFNNLPSYSNQNRGKPARLGNAEQPSFSNSAWKDGVAPPFTGPRRSRPQSPGIGSSDGKKNRLGGEGSNAHRPQRMILADTRPQKRLRLGEKMDEAQSPSDAVQWERRNVFGNNSRKHPNYEEPNIRTTRGFVEEESTNLEAESSNKFVPRATTSSEWRRSKMQITDVEMSAAQRSPEIIDLEEPDGASTDDLNLLQSSSRNYDLEMDSPPKSKSLDRRTGNHFQLAPDGEHTQWLSDALSPNVIELDGIDDDSIEAFSSPRAHEATVPPRLAPSNVREKIQMYEHRSPPRVDLLQENKRLRMKSKSSQLKGPLAALLGGTNSKNRKRKEKSTEFLPVKSSCIYGKLEERMGYKLVREGNYIRMVKGDDLISQMIPSSFQTVEHTQYGASADLKHAILILKKNDNSKACFYFDTSHADWSVPNYGTLVEWLLTKVKGRSTLSPAAAKALWDDEMGLCAHTRRSLPPFRVHVDELDPTTLSDTSVKPSDKPLSIRASSQSETVDGRPRQPQNRGPGATKELAKQEPESTRPRPKPVSKAIANTANSKPPSTKTKQLQLTTPLRRSTRHSAPEKLPQVDPDEVILVYPAGVPGAVNITNADIARLEPGAFLNDILIEFGLKLWLKGLEETNPELAEQVHVFSSFFYKKLNKRNIQEGYNSVRKWTSKFDLFKKKYIIVPINENMHWYLAIIYEPEHVLLPVSSEAPMTRQQARSAQSQTSKPNAEDVKQLDHPEPSESDIPSPSEAEVEEGLTVLTQACSIKDESDDATANPEMEVDKATYPPEPPSPTLSYVDEVPAAGPDSKTDDSLSISAMRYSPEAYSPQPPSPVLSYVDELEEVVQDSKASNSRSISPMRYSPEVPYTPQHMPASGPSATASDSQSAAAEDDADMLNISDHTFEEVEEPAGPSSGVDPANFYGKPSKQYGKKKAPIWQQPKPARPAELQVDNESELLDSAPHPQRTCVFTLDSLGSAHVQATRQLTKYLKLEAKDKKGIDVQNKIDSRHASVPTQPNFCDCGIYLLHLAEMFISKPKFYYEKSYATQKSVPNSVRQRDWHDEKVPGKRQYLLDRIKELSEEWKMSRQEKEAAKKLECDPEADPQDSDIDIIETVVPPTKQKPRSPYTPHTPAARIR